MRAARFGLVAPFLVILAACDTAPSTAPTLAVASSVPAAGVQSLRGQWEGTATFQSLSGVPPPCTPLMWRPGASDATSAEIIWGGTAGVLMTLHQRATEDCRFLLTESSGRITGAAWPDDPFDCLLVPSFCSDRCLIRTTSSTWNCEGTPPELWVADLALNAEVSSARDRMDGTVAITYAHRPGGSVGEGGWSNATVVTTFELRKRVR